MIFEVEAFSLIRWHTLNAEICQCTHVYLLANLPA